MPGELLLYKTGRYITKCRWDGVICGTGYTVWFQPLICPLFIRKGFFVGLFIIWGYFLFIVYYRTQIPESRYIYFQDSTLALALFPTYRVFYYEIHLINTKIIPVVPYDKERYLDIEPPVSTTWNIAVFSHSDKCHARPRQHTLCRVWYSNQNLPKATMPDVRT